MITLSSSTDYTTGHSYLLMRWNAKVIEKITVLEITVTSYHIEYENGATSWLLKKDLHEDYKVIEDLGNRQLKQQSS